FVIPRPTVSVALPGVAGDPMQTHDAHPARALFALCRYHSTFAGGERFRRIEAKRSQLTQRPDSPTPILGRKGVRGIFDHTQLVRASERMKFIKITGLPRHVDRHQCACPLGNLSLCSGSVDIESDWIDVYQHGTRSKIL